MALTEVLGQASNRPSWLTKNLPAEILHSELFVFDIRFMNGQKIKVNIANDIEIEYERLEEQMDQVTGQYVWWAAVLSESESVVAVLEKRIKIRRGELVDIMLKQFASANLKTPTDKQTTAICEKDDTLNKWEIALIRLQSNTNKLHHMVKAIAMKSELLRSRSGFKRKELDQH